MPLDTAKAFPNPPAPQQADQTPPPAQGLILGSALQKAHFPVSKFPFYSTKKNTLFFFLWFVVFSFFFFHISQIIPFLISVKLFAVNHGGNQGETCQGLRRIKD